MNLMNTMNTRSYTTLLSLMSAVLLVFLVAACGDEAEPDAAAAGEATQEEAGDMNHENMNGMERQDEATQPRVEDGVQVVEVEATTRGFRPQRIQLEPGVPARLVFRRTTESSCMEQVQVPAFGIEKTDLPMNEPVAVEFTPEETGTFNFICGMDMQRGTLVVQS